MFADFKDEEGKSFSELVFHHPNHTRLNREVKLVLMKLFASGILVPRAVSKKVEGITVPTNVHANLGHDRRGTPLYQNDSFWSGFELIAE